MRPLRTRSSSLLSGQLASALVGKQKRRDRFPFRVKQQRRQGSARPRGFE